MRTNEEAMALVNEIVTEQAQEWNDAHPVGTPVRYWPGMRTGIGRKGVTTSEAWAIGGHTAVVRIDTDSSCIALSHVEPAESPRNLMSSDVYIDSLEYEDSALDEMEAQQ